MRIQTETMTRSLSKRIRNALRADPRSRSLRPRHGADWRLAVVTGAKTKPLLAPFVAGKQLTRRFQLEPIQWVGTTRSLTTV